jgi:hypothetical protein
MGDDVDLAARVSPDEHPLQAANEFGQHFLDSAAFWCEARRSRRFEIDFRWRTQNRRLRLEGIDLIERPQEREDNVAIVDRIAHRRRERLPQLLEPFLILRIVHRSVRSLTRELPRWPNVGSRFRQVF